MRVGRSALSFCFKDGKKTETFDDHSISTNLIESDGENWPKVDRGICPQPPPEIGRRQNPKPWLYHSP